jgi:hypothetical protein
MDKIFDIKAKSAFSRIAFKFGDLLLSAKNAFCGNHFNKEIAIDFEVL